jgi:uncharacterized membrane protein YvlD (DUF360 family)
MIKKTLRTIILFCLSIYLSNLIWNNINFNHKLGILITASLILTIFKYFVKPVLKILLLPVTILTLGLARIFINTLGLYTTVYFANNFNISNINTSAFTWQSINFPSIKVNSVAAYFLTTITINIIYNWLKNILVRVKKVRI